MTMLDYQKTILNKVSFDKNLFRKELKKSYKWLKNDEIKNLSSWVKDQYYRMYPEVIQEITESQTY